ncbi:MAG: hypothetical protein WEA82_03800 [Idiomarina sp.]
MNKIIIGLIMAFAMVANSAHAHRFSTSFLDIDTGHDHPQEFDWSWRLVEHDLAVVAPFLVGADKKLLPLGQLEAKQQEFSELISSALSFNQECPIEVLSAIHISREVYAGQDFIEIYGHGGCPLDTLNQIKVTKLFEAISDHKVIVEINGMEERNVLSPSQPQWQKN